MIAGDFVLVRGRGVWSDVIEWADRSPYTHVQSVIDSQSYLDPVWPLVNRVYATLQNDPVHYYVNVDLTLEERQKVSDELIKYVGTHYSVAGFLWCGLVLFFPWLKRFKDPFSFIGPVCSTALAESYYRAGVYDKLKLDIPPEDVNPADLARVWVK